MLALGIDPDLHHTGLALVSEDDTVEVAMAVVPTRYKRGDAVLIMIDMLRVKIAEILEGSPVDLVVVEGQQKYKNKRTRPEDLINLATIAGAGLAYGMVGADTLALRPLPSKWKGTVPKGIHQGRILQSVGYASVLLGRDKGAMPETPTMIFGGGDIPAKHWTHVVDAIGLAKWGLAELRKAQKRAERLAQLDGNV